jgi:hypothetical protein
MLAVVSDSPVSAGKGRPTPKRRDARKQRRTATPTNRKEAAKLRRERLREERGTQRSALRSGDERHLPARDTGPAKRTARDYVDSRFTLGQVFFGIIVLALVPSFLRVNSGIVITVINLALLLAFVAVIMDAARVGKAARRAVEAEYGDKAGTGVMGYAMMRAMQPRRMRRPPAKVKRGGPVQPG